MKEKFKVTILWLPFVSWLYLISVLVCRSTQSILCTDLQQIGINIILAVGPNLIVGFRANFHLGMLVSWRLVPAPLLLVLNHQPTKFL